MRAGGCTILLRQSRALLYIPAILASSNKGWQRLWFYFRNDGELLPPFSQRVVTVAADAWRHGTPHDRQKNLEPLLKALEVLQKGGLTTTGVIAAIHRRRVLPLAERRLPLWEMTPEADMEGSRMSSELHHPAEAVAGVAVYSCHPRVLEQGVAAPVVLLPE